MTQSSSLLTVTVTLLSFLGGIVPVFLGLIAAKLISSKRFIISKYTVEFSLGVLLSTFYDLLQPAGSELATLSLIPQATIVILFLIGLLTIQLLTKVGIRDGLLLPSVLAYGWALGLGLHGLGEGIVIGYGFISDPSAYGNVLQILSYGLHKFGEGFTLGTLLAMSARDARSWGINGLIAGLPVGLGGVLGYATDPASISTYAFAVGAGFAAYFTIQFSKLLPKKGFAAYAALAVGFLFTYFAGLLHQF